MEDPQKPVLDALYTVFVKGLPEPFLEKFRFIMKKVSLYALYNKRELWKEISALTANETLKATTFLCALLDVDVDTFLFRKVPCWTVMFTIDL